VVEDLTLAVIGNTLDEVGPVEDAKSFDLGKLASLTFEVFRVGFLDVTPFEEVDEEGVDDVLFVFVVVIGIFLGTFGNERIEEEEEEEDKTGKDKVPDGTGALESETDRPKAGSGTSGNEDIREEEVAKKG